MGVYPENGHIVVTKNGVRQFSTEAPPINLFIEHQITTTVVKNFPEFPKDWIYGYKRENIADTGIGNDTFYIGYAIIISKIIPSEWNSSEVIGVVPDGCNYIDVRAILTWTAQPSSSGGSPVRCPLHIGGQVHLQGGSGVLEIGSGFRRAIHVGLVGSDVVLTCSQSSRNQQPLFSYDAWGSPTQTGWSYLSSPLGTLQNLIGKSTRSSTSVAFTPPYRGGPAQASVSAPDNHASSWSIQFIITPGRVNPGV